METIKQKTNTEKMNSSRSIRWIFAIVILLVILVTIVVPRQPRQYVIESDQKISESLYVKKDSDSLYTISVKKFFADKKYIEESFKIDTKMDKLDSIIDKTYSPFFDCTKRSNRKIIYVVLDVSGSYPKDKVLTQIETILRDKDIQPGDQVRVRFLGTKNDDVRTIDFIGPSFTYKINPNDVQNKTTLVLTGYSFDSNFQGCDSDPNTQVAKSRGDLLDNITGLYDKRKATSDNQTNIPDLLTKVSNEMASIKGDDKFKSVMYIVLTDGESTSGYLGCNTLSADQCGEELKGLSINNELDRAYIVGLNSGKEEIFRKLFNSIKLIYFQ